MRPGRLIPLSALLLLAAATTGRAGLIVSIGPAGGIVVPQGGSAIFDVLIRSDPGTTTDVGVFAITLNISSPLGNSGRLEFANANHQPTNFDQTAGGIPYIFQGDSDYASHPSDFVHVGNNMVPNDQYAAGDNTIDFGTNVSVGGTDFLLAQVLITLPSFPRSEPGEIFTISIDTGPSNTYFTTADGNVNQSYNLDASNTVTVGLAAVPEPSTIILLGIGMAGLLARHMWRRGLPPGEQTD